jgi:hypothetical protein
MTPHDEGRKLIELERELELAYPRVPVDKVRAAVENTWMQYLHAPVRDYVPLLVRREVGDWLRSTA